MFLSSIRNLTTKALASNRGNVAVMFALSMPVVIGGAGLGVETTYWRYKQTQLQAAADAAAYAGAIEKRAGSNTTKVTTVAKAASGQNGFPTPATTATVTFPSTVNGVAVVNGVQVALETPGKRFFTSYFSKTAITFKATAIASATNTGQSCILALDPAASGAVNVWGSAILQITGCSVMANSISSTAVTTGGSSNTTVPCLYSGGGVSLGSTVTLTGCSAAVTDAAPAADPYAALPQKTNTCPTGSKSASGGGALTPGNYCSGFKITSKDATLAPGDYIVDGDFEIKGNPTITGDGVTIHLMNDGRVNINGNAKVQLKAPTTGVYAGILFFGNRSSTSVTDNKLNGTADSLLTGVAYFPSQPVTWQGNFSGINGCAQVVAKTVQWTGNATIKQDCTSLGMQPVPMPGTVRLVG